MQNIEFNVDVNGDGDGDKSRLIQWMILINVLRDIHQRNNETGQRTDLDGCDISFCLWLFVFVSFSFLFSFSFSLLVPVYVTWILHYGWNRTGCGAGWLWGCPLALGIRSRNPQVAWICAGSGSGYVSVGLAGLLAGLLDGLLAGLQAGWQAGLVIAGWLADWLTDYAAPLFGRVIQSARNSVCPKSRHHATRYSTRRAPPIDTERNPASQADQRLLLLLFAT